MWEGGSVALPQLLILIPPPKVGSVFQGVLENEPSLMFSRPDSPLKPTPPPYWLAESQLLRAGVPGQTLSLQTSLTPGSAWRPAAVSSLASQRCVPV